MSFDLCQVKKAEKPYYIESIGIHIYTIEELCFYLYENIYLIDQTIINEALCDWLRDELGLKKLYRQLYEQLEKTGRHRLFCAAHFPGDRLPVAGKDAADAGEAGKAGGTAGGYAPEAEGRLSGKMRYVQQCHARIRADFKPAGTGKSGGSVLRGDLEQPGLRLCQMFLFEDAADCFLKGIPAGGDERTAAPLCERASPLSV